MKSSTKDFIKTHGRVVLMVIVGSLIYSLGMNLFYRVFLRTVMQN